MSPVDGPGPRLVLFQQSQCAETLAYPIRHAALLRKTGHDPQEEGPEQPAKLAGDIFLLIHSPVLIPTAAPAVVP